MMKLGLGIGKDHLIHLQRKRLFRPKKGTTCNYPPLAILAHSEASLAQNSSR
ncbi:hypothetical protein M9H77_28086 [Catharanthus roseus]|uniref:Uncharacterized protein n=1 Tax=Catharanthus roseus TaxID=4058 RepID=A0ACC0AED6_CATRO|nr:hypothetical protein M9H77_28086 [Catharanthus roseus]